MGELGKNHFPFALLQEMRSHGLRRVPRAGTLTPAVVASAIESVLS